MKRINILRVLAASMLVLTLVESCKKDPVTGTDDDGGTIEMVEMTPYTFISPTYFPKVDIPEDNQLYIERIALGKKLFFDTRLSNDGQNCASCHKPEYGFSDNKLSSFDKNQTSLPLINLAWADTFMWNGRVAGTLEDVMLTELNVRFNTDIDKINGIDEYRVMFRNFYGVATIEKKDLAYALAQYMRVLISRDTKYERYIKGQATLNPLEEAGRAIFFSERGDCFHCHTNLIGTDNMMHNNGLDSTYDKEIDLGFYNHTGDPVDKGKFKTPNLRNVALRTHFMHDGRFTTLEEVIRFYNTGVKKVPNVDPLMTKPNRDDILGLGLKDFEIEQLVAFLHTFTDSAMINNPEFAPPQ